MSRLFIVFLRFPHIAVELEKLWIFFSAAGVLKGYDPLLNLVLDGTTEYLRGLKVLWLVIDSSLLLWCKKCSQYDHLLYFSLVLSIWYFIFLDPDDPYKLTEDTRELGLVVCRGTSVVLICPSDGMEAIANPFIAQDG